MRRRRSRKRALGTRRPILVPDRANQRWSLDFVSDAFEDGQRFRVLCIVDDCTREALATVKEKGLWQSLSKEEQVTLAEIDNLIQTRLWLVVVLDVATRMPLTQPPDPGRSGVESVPVSFC